MRPVNLQSIVMAYRGLNTVQRENLYKTWQIVPKSSELEVLEYLVVQMVGMKKYSSVEIAMMLDDCFFGFKIPQISAQFDSLWIGETTVVNIELKSGAVEEKRIQNQLIHNQYYLRHLKKKDVLSYAIVSSTTQSFSLNPNGDLVSVPLTDVVTALYNIHQESLFCEDIEQLFPPERFLVSPFNSTGDFLEKHYFLTQQQQEIKEKAIKFINNANSNDLFCAITGGPGSGKSLLMYDIARSLMQTAKNVLIGQSGKLNEGHKKLIDKGWNIKCTRDILHFDFANQTHYMDEADVLFIDEAQRCRNLNQIVQVVNKSNCKCVFSYDSNQIMKDEERQRDYSGKIQSLVGSNNYKLTSNIRTNAAVYEFVNALFDKRHSVNKPIRGNVLITYCQNEKEARIILEVLKQKGYEVPKYTPRVHGEDEHESWFPSDTLNSHDVIGQEFNDVACLLSRNMYYNENGKLVSRAKYLYLEDRMLYQILTRARKKLHLVIFNNQPILERCMKLISSVDGKPENAGSYCPV